MMRVEIRNERPNNSSVEDQTASLEQVRREIGCRQYPRKELSEVLEAYNASIGNEGSEQVGRLRKGASCVVTGQQLGLAGGPAYTILKGISCLLAARAFDAVPIFWLATEDHDIAEVDHATFVDSDGNLKRCQVSLPRSGIALEGIMLTDDHVEQLKPLWELARLPQDLMPHAGMRYAEAMAKILVYAFAGTGMLFIEPRCLRPLASPFFQKEIAASEEIQDVLKKSAQAIQADGGNTPLTFEDGSNLFMLDDAGRRARIKRVGEGFVAGSLTFTKDQLIRLAADEPGHFSTNVASRPLVQSLLIPTLAYVAGPSEQAYYSQLAAYHRFHEVPVPCILPRQSATMISPHVSSLLRDGGLQPWDPIPESGKANHYLRNWLRPHNLLQERVLNWWGFQSGARDNLVKACLSAVDRRVQGHYYITYE